MNTDTLMPIILSLLRDVLKTLGAGAVTAGILSESQLTQLIGAAVVVVSIAWSQWQLRANAQKTAAKEIAAASTGTTTADRAGVAVPPAVQAKAADIVAAAISDKQGA